MRNRRRRSACFPPILTRLAQSLWSRRRIEASEPFLLREAIGSISSAALANFLSRSRLHSLHSFMSFPSHLAKDGSPSPSSAHETVAFDQDVFASFSPGSTNKLTSRLAWLNCSYPTLQIPSSTRSASGRLLGPPSNAPDYRI